MSKIMLVATVNVRSILSENRFCELLQSFRMSSIDVLLMQEGCLSKLQADNCKVFVKIMRQLN